MGVAEVYNEMRPRRVGGLQGLVVRGKGDGEGAGRTETGAILAAQ